MSDIPSELLDAQRHFDSAHDELMAAPADLQVDERQRLRDAERQAALVLHRARAGTAWATVAGQRALQKAAREDGEA